MVVRVLIINMSERKILVVYYSRSGTTRRIAESISGKLSCDIEEVVDLKNRGGPIGWLSAGRDAGNKSLTKIEKPKKDPEPYNHVILGSPIWNGSISTPIRTYMTENKHALGNTSIFITGDASDNSKLVLDVEAILGKKPVGFLSLNKKLDVDSGKFDEKINEFLKSLNLGKID